MLTEYYILEKLNKIIELLERLEKWERLK